MPVAHFLLGCLFLNDLLFFCCLLLLCLYMVSVFGASQAPSPVSVVRYGARVFSCLSGSGAQSPLPLCPDGLLSAAAEGGRTACRDIYLRGFRLTPEHSVSSCQPQALLGSLKQVPRLALSSCLLIMHAVTHILHRC